MEELTKNNHESMETVVETFLIEETVDLIHDNEQLDKWNKHVEDLGLTGQTQIVKKGKSPIPFMHLKKSHQNICTTLCPRKEDIENYSATPIPVEILDLIALSKKEGYFNKMQIWYDDKSPDPFAVGIKGVWYSYGLDNITKDFQTEKEAKEYCKGTQSESVYFREWGAQYYLLGKWADVKHSWDELKEMATKRFIAEKSNEYHNKIKEAKRGLEDIKNEAFDEFN